MKGSQESPFWVWRCPQVPRPPPRMGESLMPFSCLGRVALPQRWQLPWRSPCTGPASPHPAVTTFPTILFKGRHFALFPLQPTRPPGSRELWESRGSTGLWASTPGLGTRDLSHGAPSTAKNTQHRAWGIGDIAELQSPVAW